MRTIACALACSLLVSSASGNGKPISLWDSQLDLLRQLRSEGEVKEFDPERPATVLISFVKHELTASPRRIAELPAPLRPMVIKYGETAVSGKQYLEILVAICELVGEGRLSPQEGLMVLDSDSGYGAAWLVVHYRYPPLAAALRKMLPRYANRPEDQRFFEDILSGRLYREWWWDVTAVGYPPPAPVAGPPLPNPGYRLLAKVLVVLSLVVAPIYWLRKRLRQRRLKTAAD